MLSQYYKNINNETQKKIKTHGSLRERYILCLKDQGIQQSRGRWVFIKVAVESEFDGAESFRLEGAEDGFRDVNNVKAQISDDLAELIDKMRTEIGRHYSIRTEEAYVEWAYRYAKFLGPRHIQAAGREDDRNYLEHLAKERKVAASVQRQALNTLVFLPGSVG